jgi:hypothetical protein
MDAEERLRTIALLCQIDPALRRVAAFRVFMPRSLSETGFFQRPAVLDSCSDFEAIRQSAGARALLRTLLPEELTPQTFSALMEALAVDAGAVVPGLERLLADRTPAIHLGAAVALSLLSAPAAVPALRRILPAAPPPIFLLALQALAWVDAETAVPLLAVFCLTAPPIAFQPLPEAQLGIVARAPGFGGLPLGQLARVHAWFSQPPQGEALGHLGSWETRSPDARDRNRSPRDDFARVGLWNLGSKDLLVPISALAAGNGDGIVSARDPRLFETLAVALLRHRSLESGQRIGLAALRGLLALGEPRGLALLRWFGSVWRRPASDPIVWQQARAAAICLRDRLGAVGGELVPAGTPAGRGTELAGDGDR